MTSNPEHDAGFRPNHSQGSFLDKRDRRPTAEDAIQRDITSLVLAVREARDLAFASAVSAACDCYDFGGHEGDCAASGIIARASREPAIPLGARVHVESMGAEGVVIGTDGVEGEALGVMLDNGPTYCVSVAECEVVAQATQ